MHCIYVPAVPFCQLEFSGPRASIRRYERAEVPAGTLGSAFREHRWLRGLEQMAGGRGDLRFACYVSRVAVNRGSPAVKHLPAAIAFPGYDWRAPLLSKFVKRSVWSSKSQ